MAAEAVVRDGWLLMAIPMVPLLLWFVAQLFMLRELRLLSRDLRALSEHVVASGTDSAVERIGAPDAEKASPHQAADPPE